MPQKTTALILLCPIITALWSSPAGRTAASRCFCARQDHSNADLVDPSRFLQSEPEFSFDRGEMEPVDIAEAVHLLTNWLARADTVVGPRAVMQNEPVALAFVDNPRFHTSSATSLTCSLESGMLLWERQLALAFGPHGNATVSPPLSGRTMTWKESSVMVAQSALRDGRIRLLFELRAANAAPGAAPLWRESRDVRIRVVQSLSEVYAPVCTAELDQLVNSLLKPVLAETEEGWFLTMSLPNREWPTEVALGAKFEVLSGGVLIGVASARLDRRSDEMESSLVILQPAWLSVGAERIGKESLVLRVSPDPALAVRDAAARCYWAGAVSMPLEAKKLVVGADGARKR